MIAGGSGEVEPKYCQNAWAYAVCGGTNQSTHIMVYNGRGEIGLVLAVNFFPKKSSPSHEFGGGR